MADAIRHAIRDAADTIPACPHPRAIGPDMAAF
jgi:hypothetical protein